MEKAKAVLDIGNKKIKLFQKELDVSKTASGHFSLDIEPKGIKRKILKWTSNVWFQTRRRN